MESFVPLQSNDDQEIAWLNAKIAEDLIIQRKVNFVEAFNRDVETLNQYLYNPPSFKKALLAEQESAQAYNAMLEYSQKRWNKSKKDYDVGRNVIRNLAVLKLEYEEAKKARESQEVKRANVELFLDPKQALWESLEKSVHLLPNASEATSRLKTLKSDWTFQDAFALYNTDDLLLVLDEFYDFKWFLGLLKKSLKKDKEEHKALHESFIANQKALEKMIQRIHAAMAWRLEASHLRKDLYFDDNYWAFIQHLRAVVPEDCLKKYKIHELEHSETQNLGPNSYLILTELLVSAESEYDKERVFNTRWVQNTDKPLKLQRLNTQVVPSSLKTMIPDRLGWNPSNWVRYFFFRLEEEQPPWSLIKKMLVGEPSQAVVVIQEACHQLEHFSKHVQEYQTLDEFIQHPGFKLALDVVGLLEQERHRTDRFRVPWWIRLFLFTPGIETQTQTFLAEYDTLLSKAQKSIHQHGASVTKFLLEMLQQKLLFEIQDNVFSLPRPLFKHLQDYIMRYGTKAQQEEYHTLISPITLFKQFNFFKPNEENPYRRELNLDAVDAFVRYAEKYWTKPNQKAAKAVMDVLTGERVPKNHAEERALARALLPWLAENASSHDVLQLLQWVANHIVGRIGDAQNPYHYRFLIRFSPEAARIWRDDKERDLNQKFATIMGLFRKRNGYEIDVYNPKPQQVGLDYFRSYLKELSLDETFEELFMSGLIRGAREYLNQYNGESGHYVALYYLLMMKDPSHDLFYQWLALRIQALMKLDTEVVLIDAEAEVYKKIVEDERTQALLAQSIESHYQGENGYAYNLIKAFKSKRLEAQYLSKRFIWLVESQVEVQFQKEEPLFAKVKKHPAFVDAVSTYLSNQIDNMAKKNQQTLLHSSKTFYLIEQYANQSLKEKYRLMRIKDLFELKTKTDIDDYLNRLAEVLQGLDLKSAFGEQSRLTLAELFEAKAKEMQLKQDWHGNWQYIMEHFPYPENETALALTHRVWFYEFVFKTQSFTRQGMMNREAQDLNMHFKNVLVPNDRQSIQSFYGAHTPTIIDWVFKRLDTFDLFIEDSVVTLLGRYTQDGLLRAQSKWKTYQTKLDTVKRAQEFSHYMIKGCYDQARLYLDQIVNQTVANELVKGRHKTSLKMYYEQVMQSIEFQILEFYRKEIVPSSQRNEMQNAHVSLSFFEEHLWNDREPLYYQEDFEWLNRHKKEIQQHAQQLIDNLDRFNLNDLDLSYKNASLLQKGLSFEVKEGLSKKFDVLHTDKGSDKALVSGLKAFMRVMFNQGNKQQRAKDIKTLNEYALNQDQKPIIVKHRIEKIIATLRKGHSLADDQLFSTSRRYLMNFLQCADKKDLQELAKTLFDCIQTFYERESDHTLTSEYDNWQHHFELYRCLSKLKVFGRRNRNTLERWVGECLARVDEQFEPLLEECRKCNQEGMMSFLGSWMRWGKDVEQENLDKEQLKQQFLHDAFFIRIFGGALEKAKLKPKMEHMRTLQRSLLMRLPVHPTQESTLLYIFDLVQLAGNRTQRDLNAELKGAWSVYQGDPTPDNMRVIHKKALMEAIPQYLDQVNHHLFNYFYSDFHFNEDEQSELQKKLQFKKLQYDLSGDFIAPNLVIQNHKVNAFTQCLLDIHHEKKGLLDRLKKPQDRHGLRLFAAFCTSLRAEQLAEDWKKKLREQGSKFFKEFTFEKLSKPLLDFIDELDSTYSLGSARFKQSLQEAISVGEQYFISCENDETLEDKVESKEKLRA